MDKIYTVPIFLGFGFCPPQSMVKTGNRHLFRYRFVPPRLMRANDHLTNAAINFAAEHGALGTELRPEEIPAEVEPALALTPEGLAYFNSLPLYGELVMKDPKAFWRQFWEGEESLKLRSNGPEAMLWEALKMDPQHLWAQKCLEGYHDLLENHPVHGPMAMTMDNQAETTGPGRTRTLPSPKNVERKPDVVLRHETEKVGYPSGLYKAVVIGLDDSRVEHFKATIAPPNSITEGSLGVLKAGEESFDWKPYHLLRYEASCMFVPELVEWARREGIEYKGPGAVLAIEPVFGHLMPRVTFQHKPEQSGWRAAIVSSMSLSELDPTWFAWIEDEVRKQMA